MAMKLDEIPQEWRDRLREERRQAKRAADVFVRLCRDGDADSLYDAHLWLYECGSKAWRLAMAMVGKLPSVSAEIQCAFLPIWIESKHLALRVGHRPTMASALRVLLPGNYQGPPLRLYRGTGSRERQCHRYGFSWTTDVAVARDFAERWARPLRPIFPEQLPIHGGVILQTVVSPDAVLLIREPEDYYDEGEVVVDPYRLGKVEVAERLAFEEDDR
jgi:hypothetical protein